MQMLFCITTAHSAALSFVVVLVVFVHPPKMYVALPFVTLLGVFILLLASQF